MNCFHPHYKPLSDRVDKEIQQFKKEELETVFDKQIIISQLSEGGITYNDCNNMDLYEFEYIVRKLIKLKKEENRMREKQLKEAQQNIKR